MPRIPSQRLNPRPERPRALRPAPAGPVARPSRLPARENTASIAMAVDARPSSQGTRQPEAPIGLGIFVEPQGPGDVSPRNQQAAPMQLSPSDALSSPASVLEPLGSPLVPPPTPRIDTHAWLSPDAYNRQRNSESPLRSVAQSSESSLSPRAEANAPEPASVGSAATYGGSELDGLSSTLAQLSYADPAVTGRFLPRALTPDELDERRFSEFRQTLNTWLGTMRIWDAEGRLARVVEEPLINLGREDSYRALRVLQFVQLFVDNQLPSPWVDYQPRLDDVAMRIAAWIHPLTTCSSMRLNVFGTIAPALYRVAYTQGQNAIRLGQDDFAEGSFAAGEQWHLLVYALVGLSEASIAEVEYLLQEAFERPDVRDVCLDGDGQSSNMWHIAQSMVAAMSVLPHLQTELLAYAHSLVVAHAHMPLNVLDLAAQVRARARSHTALT